MFVNGEVIVNNKTVILSNKPLVCFTLSKEVFTDNRGYTIILRIAPSEDFS